MSEPASSTEYEARRASFWTWPGLRSRDESSEGVPGESRRRRRRRRSEVKAMPTRFERWPRKRRLRRGRARRGAGVGARGKASALARLGQGQREGEDAPGNLHDADLARHGRLVGGGRHAEVVERGDLAKRRRTTGRDCPEGVRRGSHKVSRGSKECVEGRESAHVPGLVETRSVRLFISRWVAAGEEVELAAGEDMLRLGVVGVEC